MSSLCSRSTAWLLALLLCASSFYARMARDGHQPRAGDGALVAAGPVSPVVFEPRGDGRFTSGLSFEAVLQRLAEGDDAALVDALCSTVLAVPGPVFWECPPVTAASAPTRRFEFGLLPAPGLAGAAPDATTFAQEFAAAPPGALAVSLASLGGDAVLVSPLPLPLHGPPPAFSHLSTFLASAGAEQRLALWTTVGREALRLLGDKSRSEPLWISTSGLGVAWLHVRLDERPKARELRGCCACKPCFGRSTYIHRPLSRSTTSARHTSAAADAEAADGSPTSDAQGSHEALFSVARHHSVTKDTLPRGCARRDPCKRRSRANTEHGV